MITELSMQGLPGHVAASNQGQVVESSRRMKRPGACHALRFDLSERDALRREGTTPSRVRFLNGTSDRRKKPSQSFLRRARGIQPSFNLEIPKYNFTIHPATRHPKASTSASRTAVT